jgi:small multidrug resistance pump
MADTLRGYRRWFAAAAVYNLLWGTAVVLFPQPLLDAAGIEDPHAVPFAQVIGMMVGVYAYGYYLLARAPRRYCGLIWIAIAGKTFGPLGFLYGATMGTMPWRFAWVIVFNDLIWWPAFWRFALRHAKEPYAER